jgi:catalase (peroxidase I)
MDASIAFERGRPENAGQAAFNDTIFSFSVERTPVTSMADLIAVAAVLAVKACGGPDIPFRAGRVDAQAPSQITNGVPVPQQDLATHTADFARLGFNATEMIGLVACGHTIGGVHGKEFPQIAAGVSVSLSL